MQNFSQPKLEQFLKELETEIQEIEILLQSAKSGGGPVDSTEVVESVAMAAAGKEEEPEQECLEPSQEPALPKVIEIKMKPGQGYSWLAKSINTQMEGVEGYTPMKSGTLNKRMGAQMLYRNHVYYFPVEELLGTGFLSGGMNSKQVKTAQAGARYWKAEGKERWLANRDLKEVLEVVEGGEATKPNQVTQEEFDDAVSDLGDIRLGKGDFTIDTSKMSPEDAKKFREDSLDVITTAMSTPTGRTLVDQLNDSTMVDDSGEERRFLDDGTEVTGQPNESDGSPRSHHTTLTSYHQDGDPTKPLDLTNAMADDGANPEYSERLADGTRGAGNDVAIRMNPGHPIIDSHTGHAEHSPQDVTFVHEGSHAVGETQGMLPYDSAEIKEDTIDPTTGVAPIECRDDLIDANHPDIGQQEWEHQAMGVGHYQDEEVSETKYIDERQELGAKGNDGAPLEDRETYVDHDH